MGLPRCAGIAPRGSGGFRPGFRREFPSLVVFVVLVFVCGSCGVVAVSSVSGRRLGGSAVRSACRARVRSWLGGGWVAARSVRGRLASVRAVLRGSRLAVLRRRAARVRAAGFRAECGLPGVVVRASRVVFRRVFGLRAVRAGGRFRAVLRLRGGFPGFSFGALVRACWGGLPPRACGRIGVVRRGGACWAWVLAAGGVAGRGVWLPARLPAGVWPVVAVLPSGPGGGGGGRRPSVPVARDSVFTAPGAGSALWLSSPAVVSAVESGACPVSLALRVFRWPVRSAVLWSMWGALCTRAILSVPRSTLSAFIQTGLSALGWRYSPARSEIWRLKGSERGSSVLAFLRVRSHGALLPSIVQKWCQSASWSVSALRSALSSVTRCLSWLSQHSSGRVSCPPALRGALSACITCALTALSNGVGC